MKTTSHILKEKIILPGIVMSLSFQLAAQTPACFTGATCDTCKREKDEEADLKMGMNKLWEDHIIWTRQLILCLADGLPGVDQAITRLQQNKTDIGNAVRPYYGDERSKQFTRLLSARDQITGEVIKADKALDELSLAVANKKWYANADEISQLLCGTNAKWGLVNIKKMMKDQLRLTNEEALQRIGKNYSEDVRVFDKFHQEVLDMSDMISEGIIELNPDKFSKSNVTIKKNKEKTEPGTD